MIDQSKGLWQNDRPARYKPTSKTGRLLLYLYKLSDSRRLKRLFYIDVLALLFLFVSDIHRYGAWYTGNASFVKPGWEYVLAAFWILIIFYAICQGIRLAVIKNRYELLAVVIIGLFVFGYFFLWTGGTLFQTNWYDVSMIRDMDRTFWEALLIPGFIAGLLGLSWWIDKKTIE